MQDGARSHIANETVRFLNQQRYLTLLQPNMWPPNIPDLNPVDYRIWREPSNHLTDCYFCVVDPSKRRKGKNASSIAPVPHTKDMPVPQPPLRDESFKTDASSTDSETEQSSAACFQSRAADERCLYYPNQEDINDLVRDLSLTKSNAELLISRLKQ